MTQVFGMLFEFVIRTKLNGLTRDHCLGRISTWQKHIGFLELALGSDHALSHKIMDIN